jgi:hypothetical protein
LAVTVATIGIERFGINEIHAHLSASKIEHLYILPGVAFEIAANAGSLGD